MKILGHVHTFNDDDVIDRCLRALDAQTEPLDEVLLVDNASSDGTLARSFPPHVSILRHDENLGTSGAVISGMKHAMERGFDWIWIFDADSAPRPDALSELIDFYEGLTEQERQKIQALASVAPSTTHGRPFQGIRFTAAGPVPVEQPRDGQPVACDAVIWSGSLYRVETIRRIGLPAADYVLDWGEFEYGFQGTRGGLHTIMIPTSLFDHDTGETGSTYYSMHGWGPFRFKLLTLPPIRIYYLVRNELYFWLHEYPAPNRLDSLRIVWGRTWMARYAMKLFLARRWQLLRSLLRGVRDGLTGTMTNRF